MQITVNGKPETIRPCTIADLVKGKGLKAEALVVEHNRCIVRQAQWAAIQLRENDCLELLSFVGGG
jgi:sulfur carrier protein